MNLEQFKAHIQRLERLRNAAKIIGFRQPKLDESLESYAADLTSHFVSVGCDPAVARAFSELGVETRHADAAADAVKNHRPFVP